MNSDDIACPRCKTTKYRNPELKLLVNICGHALCEKCIDLMFATGAAKCYQCPTPLKRGNFKKQLFQDSQVEKDIQIRKDILKKFSRTQDSFPNLRAFNDYLEKLETVIYNLANDIDVDETNKLLDELRRPDVVSSIVNQQKKPKELPYFHDVVYDIVNGPELPKLNDRYLRAIRSFSTREVAGGFTADIAIHRALGEAFTDLFSTHCKVSIE